MYECVREGEGRSGYEYVREGEERSVYGSAREKERRSGYECVREEREGRGYRKSGGQGKRSGGYGTCRVREEDKVWEV